MRQIAIGFFDIAWPHYIRHAPTPEQLLDCGRIDGIVAIYAPHWSDERVRRALQYYASRKLPLMPDKTYLSSTSPNARSVVNVKTGRRYPSISALALEMGCDPGPLCRAIKRGLPYRGVSAVFIAPRKKAS